jgi:hypothetical protein
MCFSAEVSAFTFLFGAVSSVLLIYYGNPIYRSENTVFGIILIFIAGVQLVDFFAWIDLDNSKGINNLATMIAPLYILSQPLVTYLVKILYFKPDLFSMKNSSLLILVLNLLYVLHLGTGYMEFLESKIHTTGKEHGHLSWKWTSFFSKENSAYFYPILTAINIFYLTKFKFSLLVFLITYSLLLISTNHFSYNPGELWCFFGCSIPFFLAVTSYYI